MPTFGLVVEGDFDEAALTELIRKCIGGDVEVVPRPCGPRGSLMNKFPGFLEEFKRAKQGTHVDKALVIRDANCKNPSELIIRMQGKIRSRTYPFLVKFVVIFRELETWLLADDQAISQVTQEYSGGIVNPVNEALEDILDPKGRLKQLLAPHVVYTKEVAGRIAAAVDIDRLRYRCPSFGRFQEAVSDC